MASTYLEDGEMSPVLASTHFNPHLHLARRGLYCLLCRQSVYIRKEKNAKYSSRSPEHFKKEHSSGDAFSALKSQAKQD